MNISTPNISIALRPSRALFTAITFLHAVAAITIVFVSIPVGIKLVVLVLIILLGAKAIYQFVLLSNHRAVTHISSSIASAKCKIELKNGNTIHTSLKHAGWVFDYFVVLVFSANKNIYKAIIAKDAASQEQFYALRLYLRSINTLR